MPSESSKKEIQDGINDVDEFLIASSENGLFEGQEEQFQTLQRKLEVVRANLETDDPNIPHCHRILSEIKEEHSHLVNSRPLRWRYRYVYGLYFWVYLIAIIGFVFLFYQFGIDKKLSNDLSFSDIGINASAWGVIGGCTRGIWWLWHNVNRSYLRKSWTMWFFSTPFIGGIFGAVAFLLSQAGVIVISGNENSIVSPIVIYVFGFLAGFNWVWLTDKLKLVAKN